MNITETGSQPDSKPITITEKLLQRCYWTEDNNKYFWYTDSGYWIKLIKEDLMSHVTSAGLFDGLKNANDIRPAFASFVRSVQEQNRIDWAGGIAGHRPGLLNQNGKRLLITEGPTLIDPVPGDWSFVDTYLPQLLPGIQRDYAEAYLAHAVQALYFQRRCFCQVLVLIGKKQCGKSLFQHRIVTPLLGGRFADPFFSMTGNRFNEEVVRAEHRMIEDQGESKDFSRTVFADAIKRSAANITERVEGKFGSSLQVIPIVKVLTISLNSEGRNLSLLPVIEKSFEDKLMIFSCGKATLPSDQQEIEEQMNKALPAYLHYLLYEYKQPDHIPADDRYGVESYIDVGYREKINETSNEESLKQLMFAYMNDEHAPELDLQSSIWYAQLLADEKVGKAVGHLCRTNKAFGDLLSNLESFYPDDFHSHRKSTGMFWRVRLPKASKTFESDAEFQFRRQRSARYA